MSMPFSGKKFTFTQPDGTPLEVRGWGNQSHAVFETLDGYTLAQDPVTGVYEYAKPSTDGDDLQPLGAAPGKVSAASLGLEPHLRPSRQAMRAHMVESRPLPRGGSRWERRREQAKLKRLTSAVAGGPAAAPPQQQTVGDYVGLCLLIDFPDVPRSITREEVEKFCNLPGYTGFGNAGSVRDYFADVSGGRFRYTNIVAPYYTAKQPRKYYTDPSVSYTLRARELIKEALDFHRANGLDFSKLTVDDDKFVYALNVFYAGDVVNNWSKGLWPHAYHLLTGYPIGGGRRLHDYQITNMGTELTLGTFCHENGHLVCDFPDLYDYGELPEDKSNGIGVFCLMCAGANANERNPGQVSAYLKYRAGWIDDVFTLADGMQAKLPAGKNVFGIRRRNANEYFLIENRARAGRDGVLPSSGLAIWHVDESGNNSNEQMTAAQHYECSLEQADGQFGLENGKGLGDPGDLYHAGTNTAFGDATVPASRWWDGTASGLEITQISDAGAIMTFRT